MSWYNSGAGVPAPLVTEALAKVASLAQFANG